MSEHGRRRARLTAVSFSVFSSAGPSPRPYGAHVCHRPADLLSFVAIARGREQLEQKRKRAELKRRVLSCIVHICVWHVMCVSILESLLGL